MGKNKFKQIKFNELGNGSAVVPPKKPQKPRTTYIPTRDVLGYLDEPRTIQEVMTRIGYANRNSAASALWRLQRDNLITKLSNGLFVAVNAGMKTFNVGELSEQELSEKGLLKFKQDQLVKPTPAPAHGKRYKSPSALTIKSYKQRSNAIVEYCAVPRTTGEVLTGFGYTSHNGARFILNDLVTNGRLRRIGRGVYQATEPSTVPTPATLDVIEGHKGQQLGREDMPGTAFVFENDHYPTPEDLTTPAPPAPEPSWLLTQVTARAKDYLWSKPDQDQDYEWFNNEQTRSSVLHSFIDWISQQETK